MKTVTTTIAQEIEAAELIASSLMTQVQNLESGPDGDDYYAWSGLLLRKQAQFTALCEILQDLRSAKDFEERAERFEEAYEDHIAAMEPGSWAEPDRILDADEQWERETNL
jgi:hypothetical protein